MTLGQDSARASKEEKYQNGSQATVCLDEEARIYYHIIIFMLKVIRQTNHENLPLCQIQLNLAYHSPDHFSCFPETPFCPQQRQEREPQQCQITTGSIRMHVHVHMHAYIPTPTPNKGVPFNGVVDKQRPYGEGGKTQVPMQDVTSSSVFPREWQPGPHSA